MASEAASLRVRHRSAVASLTDRAPAESTFHRVAWSSLIEIHTTSTAMLRSNNETPKLAKSCRARTWSCRSGQPHAGRAVQLTHFVEEARVHIRDTIVQVYGAYKAGEDLVSERREAVDVLRQPAECHHELKAQV